MAVGLPTHRTPCGHCRGPSMPKPRRQRRRRVRRCPTRSGARLSCGRPGRRARPTQGPQAARAKRLRPSAPVDQRGRGAARGNRRAGRRPPDAPRGAGWIAHSPQGGRAPAAVRRSQPGWGRRHCHGSSKPSLQPIATRGRPGIDPREPPRGPRGPSRRTSRSRPGASGQWIVSALVRPSPPLSCGR